MSSAVVKHLYFSYCLSTETALKPLGNKTRPDADRSYKHVGHVWDFFSTVHDEASSINLATEILDLSSASSKL